MPPLSIENNLENKITHTHTHTHTKAYKHTHTHMPSPNTHQLFGERKIYISSEELRCLCTRWVCLSLRLTPVAHLIRLLCMCVCLILCAGVWERGEYDSVCLSLYLYGWKSVREWETWETESCKHTLEAELKLSIGYGMLSHRDQSLTLINDICLLVCACVFMHHFNFHLSRKLL